MVTPAHLRRHLSNLRRRDGSAAWVRFRMGVTELEGKVCKVYISSMEPDLRLKAWIAVPPAVTHSCRCMLAEALVDGMVGTPRLVRGVACFVA